MNSYAEEALLGPKLAAASVDARFWHEPSRSRPSADRFDPVHAYTGWVESVRKGLLEMASASGPVILVAHSFGAFAAVHVAAREPQALAGLVLVEPALGLLAGFSNVLGLARQDLVAAKAPAATELSENMDAMGGLFDSHMIRAFEIALTDSALFSHYWRDKTAMGEYFGSWSKQGFGFDAESFFAVARELGVPGASELPARVIEVPSLLVFSPHDPVCRREHEMAPAQRLLSRLETLEFTGSAHFPHLEESERFVQIISRWRP